MWSRQNRQSGSNTENEDWFIFDQKNKPQSNALAGGILLMFSSGLQMGWIFNQQIFDYPFAAGRSNAILTLMKMSWFLTAAIGSIVGSFIIQKASKKFIYFLVTFLSGISTVLIMAFPDMYQTVLASRILAGYAFGVAYVTTLTHGSEIVHQRIRGLVLTSLHFLLFSGVLCFGAITSSIQDENLMHPFILLGIASTIFTALGFALIPAFSEESPVALIQQKKDQEALQIMIKVRSETQETWAIRTEFTELKKMVEEDELANNGVFSDGNSWSLLLIFLMKATFVMSFNYPLNMILLNSATISTGTDELYNLNLTIQCTARIIPMTIAIFTIDLGRRPHFIIGSVGSSLMLLFLGTLFALVETPSNAFIFGLIIAFQIFAGMGLGFTSDVMASEAFNSFKKPRSIAVVTALEFILQMILIAIFQLTKSTNFSRITILFTCGAVMLAITSFLFFKLPESAQNSIRQTRSDFTKR